MTKEQIEQWAREAGIYPVYTGDPAMQDKIDALNAQHLAQVERFAALVAAHEREQCAAACIHISIGLAEDEVSAQDCVDAILARSTG